MKFEEFKKEIIIRAEHAESCQDELDRAISANTFRALFKVIADNFTHCCDEEIINCQLLEMVGHDVINKYNFYSNSDCEDGFLLADSAIVRASGSANVTAWDSANVTAWDSANVRAWGSANVTASGSAIVTASGSAIVTASGSANVRASGSAYIDSRNNIEHKISERAILRYYHSNEVILSDGIYLTEKGKIKKQQ